ncbi:ABC transporter ATP-binding protein [Ensifer adhaerens]|uniref:ABC transporter ATP-binding protein n=1 Tax=Ensifer adhaerens TaxID=106592 RepID=UPI001CBFC86A|nr:ABC transporter ATP-binding protein [Ensifer adhaerens]MBZ7926015.1 ABC transporter ATP-binding protein [Ensifer adhaerens]UAX94833.1 ABC transporter ATP-binding protein [Ensifer adhaerens]UAY03276.1 ABC transporter ATP-binding protein [Ensifer adhaerens]UAY11261.1 ABC transporter ATP-binding protein [Ensifer adhaerens]
MPLLDIRNLSVSIPTSEGDVHAVRAVSLEIDRGEIHGVIGESGCGKTMTGMAALGLAPKGARIIADRFHFDGEDLREHAVRLRGRRIGMIAQDPAAALNPVLSIASQMDDVIRAHRDRPKRARRAEAADLLAATGLPDPEKVLRSYPHQLSGGMQQRVVIAQALATGADFLIADEPTTALDVSVGAQVLALLRKLVTERGLTVLMITHDMDVIAEACDRATVLYAGRSVETGPVDAVLQRPGHPYTRALLAALPDAAPHGARLAAIEGSIPPPRSTIAGCAFAARCPQALRECATTPPPERSRAAHHWLCHLPEDAA